MADVTCVSPPPYFPLYSQQQDYRNKELNNGRLAMIAAAGITIQEKLITGGLPEFEIHRFGLSDLAANEIGRIPGAL